MCGTPLPPATSEDLKAPHSLTWCFQAAACCTPLHQTSPTRAAAAAWGGASIAEADGGAGLGAHVSLGLQVGNHSCQLLLLGGGGGLHGGWAVEGGENDGGLLTNLGNMGGGCNLKAPGESARGGWENSFCLQPQSRNRGSHDVARAGLDSLVLMQQAWKEVQHTSSWPLKPPAGVF